MENCCIRCIHNAACVQNNAFHMETLRIVGKGKVASHVMVYVGTVAVRGKFSKSIVMLDEINFVLIR